MYIKMKTLNFKFYKKKFFLKNDTMNESQLQKYYNYPIYPRDSKLYSDKIFANIDNGQMGGTNWCVFYVKREKSFYFDSFGGQPDEFLLNQIPKPIIYNNYFLQDTNSKFCGSCCVFFSIQLKE